MEATANNFINNIVCKILHTLTQILADMEIPSIFSHVTISIQLLPAL